MVGTAVALADTKGLLVVRMVIPGVVKGEPVTHAFVLAKVTVTTSASDKEVVPKTLEVWLGTGTPLIFHWKVVPGMGGRLAVKVTLSPAQMVSLGDTLMLPLNATGAITVKAISELSPGKRGLLLPTLTR
jgi:hypothetical protein